MCGRVRLANDYSGIKIRLKFAPDAAAPNYAADYNEPPTMPMLVAMRSVDGRRVPMMKWGLVPYNIRGHGPALVGRVLGETGGCRAGMTNMTDFP
jgi:putative SOS response-associated peptidase YedK